MLILTVGIRGQLVVSYIGPIRSSTVPKYQNYCMKYAGYKSEYPKIGVIIVCYDI